MRLSRLNLRNFRGFQSLDLDFEPDVTVLVGVNGAGKTSLLDAIAWLLTPLLAGVRLGRPQAPMLAPSDVRLGCATASLTLDAELGGSPVRWSVALTREGYPAAAATEWTALQPAIDAAQRTIAAQMPRLPLAVYFPTNRSALDIPARIRTPHAFDALSAYEGALEGGASNFRGFFEWFREEEDIENEQLVQKDHGQTIAGATSGLPAVRRAIEVLFPGACELRVERRPQRMTLLYRGARLDVAQLSDGEKCLLAMAGDLARRMVLAAPGVADPLSEPAVVLIDELELHLHPGLQRMILVRLREVFPNTQFIVSTHSPQVLSSVRAANVRLLEDFALHSLTRGTWRRDTNRILETAFGDPGRPPEVAEKLNALRNAVDGERNAEARELVRELRALIEGEDPDVFFLEQQLPPEAGGAGQP